MSLPGWQMHSVFVVEARLCEQRIDLFFQLDHHQFAPDGHLAHVAPFCIKQCHATSGIHEPPLFGLWHCIAEYSEFSIILVKLAGPLHGAVKNT